MIIGRLCIAFLLFIGMALSTSAQMPSDVPCPSKTYLLSCPVDAGAATEPSTSSERPCPAKAILAKTMPERTEGVTDMSYHREPATDLMGAASGGIERPPKFSQS